MTLKYDVQLVGGPDLVFGKDLPTSWSLLGKAILIAPGLVTAYAFPGLTRRRNFLSAWIGVIVGSLALHVPASFARSRRPAVIVCINTVQAILAFLLSRTDRFSEGLRAYEQGPLRHERS